MTIDIKEIAESVGIDAFVLNSEKNWETQLNTITRDYDTPIMLIDWAVETELEFAEYGFLIAPLSKIKAFLCKKPESLTVESFTESVDEMRSLFQVFIQALYERISTYSNGNEQIKDIKLIDTPAFGLSKHCGVLASWSMSSRLEECNN